MLVHHCGKDEARGSRGHSSLRAAVDTEIELHRPEGGNVTTARVTKQRDLEGGQLFPFSLEPMNLGVNRWGEVVSSCVVRHEAEAVSDPRGGCCGVAGRRCFIRCRREERRLRGVP
jgi:hypothetical protein